MTNEERKTLHQALVDLHCVMGLLYDDAQGKSQWDMLDATAEAQSSLAKAMRAFTEGEQ